MENELIILPYIFFQMCCNLKVLLTLLLYSQCGALTAYDCRHPDVNISMIDVSTIQPCADPESDFHESRHEYVQVLHSGTANKIIAHRCYAEVSKEVTKCGFDSITYASVTTEWHEHYTVSIQECVRAFKEKKITIDGYTHENVKLGGTTHRVYSVHGRFSPERGGGCDVNSKPFQSGKHQFSYGFMEEVKVSITIKSIVATQDTVSTAILFPGAHTKSFPYEQGAAYDENLGTLLWQTKDKPDCLALWSNIYMGDSYVTALKTSNINNPLDRSGAIVMLGSNSSKTQHAGFRVGEKISLCGHPCHKISSLPHAIVCFWTTDETPIDMIEFKPEILDDFKYFNIQTRSDYQYIKGSLTRQEQLMRISQDVCRVEQKTLHNKIQAMTGVGNTHSMLDIYGKGHLVSLAGDAIYVTHCRVVNVTKWQYGNCTKEIPVQGIFTPEVLPTDYDPLTYNVTNKAFMNPSTRIIQHFPTLVTCSSSMPIRWRIGDKWYCSTPDVMECQAPSQLKAETTMYNIEDVYEDSLNPNGLISPEQRRQINAFLNEAMYRDAALNNDVRQALKNAGDGFLGMGIYNLDLDRAQEELSRSLSDRLFRMLNPLPFFTDMGRWVIPVWGMFCVALFFAQISRSIVKFSQEFYYWGWDGGRTLYRAVLSLFGIMNIPKYLCLALYKHASNNIDYEAVRRNMRLGWRRRNPAPGNSYRPNDQPDFRDDKPDTDDEGAPPSYKTERAPSEQPPEQDRERAARKPSNRARFVTEQQNWLNSIDRRLQRNARETYDHLRIPFLDPSKISETPLKMGNFLSSFQTNPEQQPATSTGTIPKSYASLSEQAKEVQHDGLQPQQEAPTAPAAEDDDFPAELGQKSEAFRAAWKRVYNQKTPPNCRKKYKFDMGHGRSVEAYNQDHANAIMSYWDGYTELPHDYDRYPLSEEDARILMIPYPRIKVNLDNRPSTQ